jgi:hypothetical protein
MNQKIKVIVRSTGKIPASWKNNDQISIIEAGISEISIEEMSNYVKDCQSVVSCLGHNLSLKGIFVGKPRKLVTESIKLISNAIQINTPKKPVRLVPDEHNS